MQVEEHHNRSDMVFIRNTLVIQMMYPLLWDVLINCKEENQTFFTNSKGNKTSIFLLTSHWEAWLPSSLMYST